MPELDPLNAIDESLVEPTGDRNPKASPYGLGVLCMRFHVTMVRRPRVGRHPPRGEPPRVGSDTAGLKVESVGGLDCRSP